MQHHQRGNNRGDIHRHHHRGIFAKAEAKEICGNDIHQVGDNKRQAGGIGNEPGRHHERKRRAFTEP